MFSWWETPFSRLLIHSRSFEILKHPPDVSTKETPGLQKSLADQRIGSDHWDCTYRQAVPYTTAGISLLAVGGIGMVWSLANMDKWKDKKDRDEPKLQLITPCLPGNPSGKVSFCKFSLLGNTGPPQHTRIASSQESRESHFPKGPCQNLPMHPWAAHLAGCLLPLP